MNKPCHHPIHEQTTAHADGLCAYCLRDEVRALEQQAPKWVSVKERLPDPIDGQDFVPVMFYGPLMSVCAGHYYPEDRTCPWIALEGARFSGGVTDWMPMPSPPSEGGGL